MDDMYSDFLADGVDSDLNDGYVPQDSVRFKASYLSRIPFANYLMP